MSKALFPSIKKEEKRASLSTAHTDDSTVKDDKETDRSELIRQRTRQSRTSNEAAKACQTTKAARAIKSMFVSALHPTTKLIPSH